MRGLICVWVPIVHKRSCICSRTRFKDTSPVLRFTSELYIFTPTQTLNPLFLRLFGTSLDLLGLAGTGAWTWASQFSSFRENIRFLVGTAYILYLYQISQNPAWSAIDQSEFLITSDTASPTGWAAGPWVQTPSSSSRTASLPWSSSPGSRCKRAASTPGSPPASPSGTS